MAPGCRHFNNQVELAAAFNWVSHKYCLSGFLAHVFRIFTHWLLSSFCKDSVAGFFAIAFPKAFAFTFAFPKTFAFAIAIPRVLLAHFLLAWPVPRPWALPLPCKARSPWLPSRSALPPNFALACWACYLGCLWLPLPSWKGLGWRGKPLASIDTAIHHCCSASAFCLFQDSLAVMQPSPRVGPFSSRYL